MTHPAAYIYVTQPSQIFCVTLQRCLNLCLAYISIWHMPRSGGNHSNNHNAWCVAAGRTLGAQASAGNQQQLLTLSDPNGDARAVVSGASQAEAHLKELNQPQHVQVDKATVEEQDRFYTGPMDVDAATIKLAEQINQTYWNEPGDRQSYIDTSAGGFFPSLYSKLQKTLRRHDMHAWSGCIRLQPQHTLPSSTYGLMCYPLFASIFCFRVLVLTSWVSMLNSERRHQQRCTAFNLTAH